MYELRRPRKRLLRTLYGGDSRMEMKRLSVTGSDKAQQVAFNDLLFSIIITRRMAS